jgi:hypothetical protein
VEAVVINTSPRTQNNDVAAYVSRLGGAELVAAELGVSADEVRDWVSGAVAAPRLARFWLDDLAGRVASPSADE